MRKRIGKKIGRTGIKILKKSAGGSLIGSGTGAFLSPPGRRGRGFKGGALLGAPLGVFGGLVSAGVQRAQGPSLEIYPRRKRKKTKSKRRR